MIVDFIVGILIVVLVLVAIIAVNEIAGYGKSLTEWNVKTDKTYLTKFGKINIVIAIVVLCLSTFVGARVHI